MSLNKLQQILHPLTPYLFGVAITGLFLVELTPLILSISIISLATISLINFQSKENNLGIFGLFNLYFLFTVISMLYSEDLGYCWERIQLKLPLLALSITWIGNWIDKTKVKLILQLFIAGTILTCGGIITNYLLNKDSIDAIYLKGQVMPTPLNHIRFSLMVALSSYVSLLFFTRSDSKIRLMYLISALLLICFLHVYSVRTGLIACYASTFYFLITEYKLHKRKSLITIIVIAGGLLVTSAYFLFPTFRGKVDDTRKDIEVYRTKGYSNYYSITTRLISYEAAIAIWKEHKLLGCGIGDIKNETDLYFKEHRPEIVTPILPHNQFLLVLASTGVIGLIIFLISFYGILWVGKLYRNRLIVAQYLIVTVAFIFEPMLETQLGVCFVMLFITIGILEQNYLRKFEQV